MLAREIDHELGEHVDDDVRGARERVFEERHPLLDREQRLLVRRVADNAHHDAIEDRGGAADHVDMPVGDGVVASRTDGCYHCENTVIRAEP